MGVTGGNLIFDGTTGNSFFAHNANVNLNNNQLFYTAKSSENLNDANFANISLLNNAIFDYTANAGTTIIDKTFYTSDGSGSFVFNGNQNSNFVLNDNLNNIKQISFNGARLSFVENLYNITNSLNLNNSIIDVMNHSIQKYTFSNLTGLVESNREQWVLMRGNAQETPEAIWYNVKFYSGDILKADLTPTSKLGDMYDSVSGKTRSFSEIDGLELVEVK